MKNVFYNNHMLPGIDMAVAEVGEKVYVQVAELAISYYKTKEPVEYIDRLNEKYQPLVVGQKWGELWDCAWLHVEGTVPKECKGKKVVLKIDVSGEALIYDEHGVPSQGLTSVADSFDPVLGSPAKTTYVLTSFSSGSEKVDLYLDCGCNDLFGKFQTGVLRKANISICNEPLRMVWYDMRVLRVLLSQLDKNSARYVSVLHALYDACNTLCEYADSEIEIASKYLSKELAKKGGDASLAISALGHSHLDLAWLWPIRETKRKAIRTFSTAIKNLEKYPDYLFCASQPQQYQWVKEQSKPLYDKIASMIKAGRIEPVGAFWVEPDLNVSSGEALVRQVLYGKQFFKNEFGVDIDNAWLPDVFGFNAALPQILAKSGISKLLTIKMSWNKYTKFPHHSFVWVGQDGKSEVLVHMPPEGSYNSAGSAESVAIAEKNYVEKGVSENAMMLYGIGDGGGGPGSSHLENIKRLKNLSGVCPVNNRTAKEFFYELEKEREALPRFKGEMYLEKHQGTYTTQGETKKGNRDMETGLVTAELLACVAKDFGFAYPKEKLEVLWKETLLYQFHDILPGSSIARVYNECNERYGEMTSQVKALQLSAVSAIGEDRDSYFNPTSFERDELVFEKGRYYHMHFMPFGKGIKGDECKSFAVVSKENHLENEFISATFGKHGEMTSVVDKRTGKELLTKANEMNVYYDDGDGWDISDSYLQKPYKTCELVTFNHSCDGVVAKRVQVMQVGKCKLEQTITLQSGSDCIVVNTNAEFMEDQKMLRADFVTTILSDTVECDIQFGKVKRPTTSNTIAEYAMNELCAQKWIDYHQPDCGVALINDCKYGYFVKGERLSIDCIRTPNYPGENADKGKHTFSYMIYVHGEVSQVEKKASNFIHPILQSPSAMPKSYLSLDKETIIVESIKECEFDDSVIVRMYECKGQNTVATLTHTLDEVRESDMTEFTGKAIDRKLAFTPFEIKTVKLMTKRR